MATVKPETTTDAQQEAFDALGRPASGVNVPAVQDNQAPVALSEMTKRDRLVAVLAGQQTLGEPSGEVDFDEAMGITKEMPIQSSLSDMVNAIGKVVEVNIIDNQFAAERPGANPKAGEFIFQDQDDGRFYRMVSSNEMSFRQAILFQRLLTAFSAVRVKVIGVSVRGQTNDAYGFGRVAETDG